jgi:hypothetical protein
MVSSAGAASVAAGASVGAAVPQAASNRLARTTTDKIMEILCFMVFSSFLYEINVMYFSPHHLKPAVRSGNFQPG